TVHGDQLGIANDDTIVLGIGGTGGVSVTLNNEIVTFEPDQVKSVIINPGNSILGDTVRVVGTLPNIPVTINCTGGTTSVAVERTSAKGPVTINSLGGKTSILVGNAGLLKDVQGQVNIVNSSTMTDLTIDDSADQSFHKVGVSSSKVTVD